VRNRTEYHYITLHWFLCNIRFLNRLNKRLYSCLSIGASVSIGSGSTTLGDLAFLDVFDLDLLLVVFDLDLLAFRDELFPDFELLFDLFLELLDFFERFDLRDFERDLLLDFFGIRDFRVLLEPRLAERDLLRDFFGALGVRARREDFFFEAERLTLFDTLRLELFEALGVRLRRLDLRRDADRLALLDFFGAIGVRLLRFELLRLVLFEADLFLDAFGVWLRRLELRLEADLLVLLDFGLLFFGALGVRLRRLELTLEADRLVLLDFDFFGAFGLLERLADRRFCFFLEGDFPLAFPSERARFFLIPISLFLFSSISALYWSRSVTHD